MQAKMDHHAVRGAYAGFLSIEERDLFCLGDGVLAGAGAHAQLLERCEIYREIYASQTGGGKK